MLLLTYEAKLFLNWMSSGCLPVGNMYDMPCDVMLTLLAIQGDVDAAVHETKLMQERAAEMGHPGAR
jgi:hypothetical protein